MGFVLKERYELIFPEFFKCGMMEVPFFPGVVVGCNAPGSSREMDMDVEFEVSAKGMKGQIDSWKKTFLFSQGDDNVGGDTGYFIQELSIDREEVPEFLWHGEGDMLPGGFRQSIKSFFNPVIGGFFTA